MAIILAVSSAFFNATSSIISRVGLRHYDPFSGFVINLMVMVAGSIAISLFTIPLDQFVNRAALYFIITGIMGPLLARFLLFSGIHRVGASIAIPIHSTRALYAVIGAVAILGESLTPPIILGIFLMILGVTTVSIEQSGGTIERQWSRKDLGFPIMAAALLGIAHVIRKVGLDMIPSPIIGVTLQNTTALIFMPLLAIAQQPKQKVILNEMRAWVIFGFSGLTLLISQLCMFYALDLGQVVIVSPLFSLSPLFVLILVAIFLRGIERLTWKIVLGTLLIVGGTTVLTLKYLG
jgi:uncharacterized membrane protein